MKTILLVLSLAMLPSTATAQLYGGYGSFYGGYAGVLRVGYVNPGYGYRTYGRYRYDRYRGSYYDYGYGCRCR